MARPERAGALLSFCRHIAATAGTSNHTLATSRQRVLQHLGSLRPGYTAGRPYQTWGPGPGRQSQHPFAPFHPPTLRDTHTTVPQDLVHPRHMQHHPFARLARLIHGTPASAAAAVSSRIGATRVKRRPLRALLLGGVPLGLGLGSLWVARTEEGRSLLKGYLALPVRLWRDVATASAMALGKGFGRELLGPSLGLRPCRIENTVQSSTVSCCAGDINCARLALPAVLKPHLLCYLLTSTVSGMPMQYR